MAPEDFMTNVPPDRWDFEYRRAIDAAKAFRQVPVVHRVYPDEPHDIVHFGEERRRVIVQSFWPDVFGTPIPKGAVLVSLRRCPAWVSCHDEWELAES